MTIRVELADDPDLSGWTELTEVKRSTLRCGGIANKTEVGTAGGFDWYDDAGDRTLPGRRPIRVIETATAPDTTLFRGRVSTKGLGRGVVVTGDSKQYGVALDDYNADLRGIIVDGWKRPAETDVARVHALIDTYLSGVDSTSTRARVSTDIADTYVAAAPTLDLPAETYRDSSPAQVLGDIVSATGKECFVTVDGELFYAAPTSTIYASTYSITDDAPDLVDELEPIWEGDAATEDPTELLSGARAKYGVGHVVNDSRSAIEDAFDKWEDTVFLDTTSGAKAALQLDALLDNQGIEEKSRRVTVMVPPDQVDRIKWGQTISFRAAAAGDLTPVTLRISYLLWEVPTSPEAPYLAHLELSRPKKIAPRVRKGTSPGGSPGGTPGGQAGADPWTGGCTVLSLGDYVGSLGISDFHGLTSWVNGYYAPYRTPAANTHAVVAASDGMATLTPDPFDASLMTRPTASVLLDLPSRPLELYYETRVETPFPSQNPQGGIMSMLTIMDPTPDHGDEVNISVEWVPSVGKLKFHVDDTLPLNIPYDDWLTDLYPSATNGSWIAIRVLWDGGLMQVSAWPLGFAEPVAWMYDAYDGENQFGDGTYFELGASGGAVVGDYFGMFAQFQNISFTGDGLDCPVPVYGQQYDWVTIAEGDGVTDEFTFPRPYVPGSLEVLVDGVWQDAGEDDPTTGAFSLGFVPEDGETVRARARIAV